MRVSTHASAEATRLSRVPQRTRAKDGTTTEIGCSRAWEARGSARHSPNPEAYDLHASKGTRTVRASPAATLPPRARFRGRVRAARARLAHADPALRGVRHSSHRLPLRRDGASETRSERCRRSLRQDLECSERRAPRIRPGDRASGKTIGRRSIRPACPESRASARTAPGARSRSVRRARVGDRRRRSAESRSGTRAEPASCCRAS